MTTYCNRCVLHTDIPSVKIGEDGTCNYCKVHDVWDKQYPIGEQGKKLLSKILDKVKKEGKNKDYDCIVGVSGGCDSSYLLTYLADYGMRPLPVHWDNNWNARVAEDNLRSVIQGLGLDSYRVGVDRKEYDDLCRSFLLASVPDADIPNDIALTTTLYLAAKRFNVKNIMIGHSFRTEGTAPLGWSYMDGGYIEDVHKTFGSIPLKTFPNLTWDRFKEFTMMGLKRWRPLWYLNYDKEKVKTELHDRFGWEWYGGHHMENDYTIFVGNYLQPKKFGIDMRYIESSAFVRSGRMLRAVAMKELTRDPEVDEELVSSVLKRLQISDGLFIAIMQAPRLTHHDYNTYQGLFKENKEFFTNALKKKLIPETFYKKYVEGVSVG
jgi:N-acetyl sugar amidotransferase